MTALLAHAGGLGWDEMLLFASPVVILIVLQVVGRRKARDQDATEQEEPE